MREFVVFPGQKVVTTAGEVVIVAFTRSDNEVWAFTARGLLPVQICTDAFGGEHDQRMGLLAA